MTWTVSALLLAASDALLARFGSVTVRGELSSLSRPGSGHLYFSLKDADGAAAVVRCVMFRRSASLLDFDPRDGQQVELRGRLALYEPRGDLQMVVEAMQRLGAGTLYEEFLRLRARLEAQGLFDPARRRPLPVWPARLGVVTSPAAAALRDVLTALARRSPQVAVRVYPCVVQGVEAPESIVAALRTAAQRAEVDVLLLVRGGGSLEDLWAFNDERVVRAVAASPIPVVCGVGHETDVTLSDLAADLRAPTPTAAAELAAPRREDALARLGQWNERALQALRRHVERQSQRLDLLGQRAGRPGVVLASQAIRLEQSEQRMRRALIARCASAAWPLTTGAHRLTRVMRTGLERRRLGLDSLEKRLEACHPRHVLKRGYAWVVAVEGSPIMRVSNLHPGQRVRAVFADGEANAQIDSIQTRRPDEGR